MATSMSGGMNASLELASMEMAARERAKKQVANLLQRPDQLEKVEMIRKRVARRKGSVEAQLKTAVQSQLDGVKTGLNQLHVALKDIREIKENLNEIDKTYKSIADLGEKLKPIREEQSRHSQLVAAVENLVHIFTVPETIKKCQDYLSEGKLLHAHKSISELENCRDDLLYELYKQPIQSPTDKNTVVQYFKELEPLSKALWKQLRLVLNRTISAVRMEPTMIVTVLRIIEREERMDAMMLKRYEQMKLSDRPKQWKQRAFEVMREGVQARIEGSQMEDRTLNKMWLVRHLEFTRQIVIEDLRVVKTMCEPCFPPHYDIVNKYIGMYHSAISQHLNDILQNLEGNEVVSLLTWINEYPSKELMGSPELNIDVSLFSPLLDKETINKLHSQYIENLKNDFKTWMEKSLRTDAKDWVRDVPPDADEKAYFNTTLPVILGQMIEQNLEVASTIGAANLVVKLVYLCIDELAAFILIYRSELMMYKQVHAANRSMPRYYLHYMIANANNCQTFGDFALRLHKKYIGKETRELQRFQAIDKAFKELAIIVCDWILEEVFLDLNEKIQDLLTKKWLADGNVVDTICITIEDYSQDFVHLRDIYYDQLLGRAQARVAREYYKALFAGKLRFRTYEERCPVVEKINKEAEQLTQLFKKLLRRSQSGESPFDAMPALAEFIKLRDTSLMSLEVTGFVNNYPDVRIDMLVSLLYMRGDINRGEAKQLVVDCLGEDYDTKQKPKKTIFSQIN